MRKVLRDMAKKYISLLSLKKTYVRIDFLKLNYNKMDKAISRKFTLEEFKNWYSVHKQLTGVQYIFLDHFVDDFKHINELIDKGQSSLSESSLSVPPMHEIASSET